jgi:hypothetical protein
VKIFFYIYKYIIVFTIVYSFCFFGSISGTLNLKNSISNEEQHFAFDILFDENSTQDQVWEQVGFPTLEKAFSGYNGTIFACMYYLFKSEYQLCFSHKLFI